MLPDIWRNRGSLTGPTMDDFLGRFLYGLPTFVRESEFSWTPRVDVHETDKEILIDAELPGIDKKDIQVELKENLLTIIGERKQERTSKNEECSRVERHYGKFERSFGLPDTVHSEKVNAEYKNGVLTLTLPKTEKAMPKEIKIDVK